MKSMGAAQFKQQCLAVLERLSPEGLIITKHGRPVAKLTPARRWQIPGRSGGLERVHDAVAHLRRRFPCKGDGEDVGRIDPCLQQIDVTVDQHPGFPGTRGSLERHVVSRVDRARAAGAIASVDS